MNRALKVATVVCLLGFALARPAAADAIREVTHTIGPVTDHLSYSRLFTSGMHDEIATQFADAQFTLPGFDLPAYQLIDAILTIEMKTKAVGQLTNLDSSLVGSTHTLYGSIQALDFRDDPATCIRTLLLGCTSMFALPGETSVSELEIERELRWDVTSSPYLSYMSPVYVDIWFVSWMDSFNGVRRASIDHDLWARASITYRYAVPEPGTLTLLGIGLAGLAFTRRRKQ